MKQDLFEFDISSCFYLLTVSRNKRNHYIEQTHMFLHGHKKQKDLSISCDYGSSYIHHLKTSNENAMLDEQETLLHKILFWD